MDCYREEHHQKQQMRSLTISFVAEAKYGDEIALCMANGANDGPLHFIEVRNAGANKPVVQALLEWAPSSPFLPFHKGLETISKITYTVTPAKAGVQNPSKDLDSGFRRNDDQGRLGHFEIVS